MFPMHVSTSWPRLLLHNPTKVVRDHPQQARFTPKAVSNKILNTEISQSESTVGKRRMITGHTKANSRSANLVGMEDLGQDGT